MGVEMEPGAAPGRGALLLLAVIIVALAAVLVFSQWMSRREGSGLSPEYLPELAARMGMELQLEPARTDEIRSITNHFARILPPAEAVGAALVREAEDHRLYVYEHRYQGRDRLPTDVPTWHRVPVEMAVILVEMPGVDQPYWHVLRGGSLKAAVERFGNLITQGLEPLPAPPGMNLSSEDSKKAAEVLTTAAIDRMASWPDVRIAGVGPYVLFAPPPPASALIAQSTRQVNPALVPSLMAPGLEIDVQRALDVVNLLNLGRDPLPRVYHLDIPKPNLPSPPKLDLSGMDKAREELEQKLEEIRERPLLEGEEAREEDQTKEAAPTKGES